MTGERERLWAREKGAAIDGKRGCQGTGSAIDSLKWGGNL